MRKTEFLQELREALDGEVSASVIQSNISYYDQYIRQEAAKGRREEEVIEEIGSPRLIAKTIIDSSARLFLLANVPQQQKFPPPCLSHIHVSRTCAPAALPFPF